MFARDLDGFVHGAFLEPGHSPDEKTQFGIRPEATMFNPSAEELILAWNQKPSRSTF